jgi:hypothetical protein
VVRKKRDYQDEKRSKDTGAPVLAGLLLGGDGHNIPIGWNSALLSLEVASERLRARLPEHRTRISTPVIYGDVVIAADTHPPRIDQVPSTKPAVTVSNR